MYLENVSDELLLKASVMTKLYTGITPLKFAMNSVTSDMLAAPALLPAHSQNAL